jgi:hypothetical protein
MRGHTRIAGRNRKCCLHAGYYFDVLHVTTVRAASDLASIVYTYKCLLDALGA